MPHVLATLDSAALWVREVSGACSYHRGPVVVIRPQAYDHVYASILENFHAISMVCGVIHRVNADGVDKQRFHQRSVEGALFGIREDVYRNRRILRGYSFATHVIHHALNNVSHWNGAW